MTEITPAILTKDIKEFESQISELYVFPKIDIDICREDFAATKTLQLSEVVEYIHQYKDVNFGIHLMVQNPKEDLDFLTENNLSDRPLRIYFHQESNLEYLDIFKWPELWSKCVSITLESEPKDFNYYQNFVEVQFMTVEIGNQGGEFQLGKVKSKIDHLKQIGYLGLMSIDGGVNSETAEDIAKLNLDRVSVGSYFANTSEDVEALKELDQKINNQI